MKKTDDEDAKRNADKAKKGWIQKSLEWKKIRWKKYEDKKATEKIDDDEKERKNLR